MRQLRVKFILPALTEATSPFWRPIKYSLFPPLGLATLAAYLAPDDSAVLVDEHVQTLSVDDRPDLVVIQVYITNAYRAYRSATRHTESALAKDRARNDVRDLAADILLDRAALADEVHDPQERDELLEYVALYDPDGSRRARWDIPGRVIVHAPGGAIISLEPPRSLGPNPGAFRSLAARNLVRGWRMRLPNGQSIARTMGVEPLANEAILIGSAADDATDIPAISKISPKFDDNCPLWVYVLAEAAHGFRTKPETEVVHTSEGDKKIETPKLGDVGGTIVAETFAGMMVDDRNSFWNLWPKWEPNRSLGGREFDLRRFIRYALA